MQFGYGADPRRHRPGVIRTASNIFNGTNPPYTVENFRTALPQFTEELVTDEMIQFYIDLADSIVKRARWHESWPLGMMLFIAHFVTLYLSAIPVDGTLSALLSASATKGVASGKTVGAVSITYDIGATISDLDGWA